MTEQFHESAVSVSKYRDTNLLGIRARRTLFPIRLSNVIVRSTDSLFLGNPVVLYQAYITCGSS
jgi:hypothetical protein